MKRIVEMPAIIKCDATSCAYNVDSACHARGITVGDKRQQHLCDTVWQAERHTQRSETAGVGACRAADCVHNDDLECQADGIAVTMVRGMPRCGTFLKK